MPDIESLQRSWRHPVLNPESLQRFCCKLALFNKTTHRGVEMRRPFLLDGYVYATNGHICCRVPAEIAPGVEPLEKRPEIDLEALFRHEQNCDLTIPDLPPPMQCISCNGTGISHLEECARCGGDGYDVYSHTCRACNGEGECYTGKPREDGKPCWNCAGRGENSHHPILVRDAYFNRPYLALAAALPGARFVRVDGYNAAHIVFDGGDIVIMPTRA